MSNINSATFIATTPAGSCIISCTSTNEIIDQLNRNPQRAEICKEWVHNGCPLKVELNASTPDIEDAIRHACRNDHIALKRMDLLVLRAALMYFQTSDNPIYGITKTTPKIDIIHRLIEEKNKSTLKNVKSSDITPQFTSSKRIADKIKRAVTSTPTEGDFTAKLSDGTVLKANTKKVLRRLLRKAGYSIKEFTTDNGKDFTLLNV